MRTYLENLIHYPNEWFVASYIEKEFWFYDPITKKFIKLSSCKGDQKIKVSECTANYVPLLMVEPCGDKFLAGHLVEISKCY